MSHWQLLPQINLPQWFLEAVQAYHESYANYLAQLLWQRGICQLETLTPFLDFNDYQPTSGHEGFGQQMELAIQRLQSAWETGKKVTIWGDFDADGITATSVLWEGLTPFFPNTLSYYIPNRLTESHGLNESGIKQLAQQGVRLIVTCDTGSSNLTEIQIANRLGIDVIITDHHTLPLEDPSAIAILNPKYLAKTHPLYHLSGVAVAYKLVESLYETFPEIPNQSVENLLDLVAIGLVADLVELQGDCRYLAQKGINQLAQQLEHPTRPGVANLLKFCKRSGDRPMDISFGIGPRINAISRIQGDASFAVELLTSRNESRCETLAKETEIANSRRKQLQKEIEQAVKHRIAQLDLSTTGVIVLADTEWNPGVLGLVAGQIAQHYNRPTVLLNIDDSANPGVAIARGSARSVQQIDLYELLRSQQHLLDRFGGHPFAAGLMLKADNIPLFREAINQQFRQNYGTIEQEPILQIDLQVTVNELGKELFQALKLLEPYGMGNPVPRLLIKDCWFGDLKHKNIQDFTRKTVKYIRTHFKICDETNPQGFQGVWWGHYQEELPQNQRCNAVVELDVDTKKQPNQYEVRLIEVKTRHDIVSYQIAGSHQLFLLDQRNQTDNDYDVNADQPIIPLKQCPRSWGELTRNLELATQKTSTVALAYSPPSSLSPEQIWKQLLGIAIYLSRREKPVTREQLTNKLGIGEPVLTLGLQALVSIGFTVEGEETIQVLGTANSQQLNNQTVQQFLEAVQEEQFRCQYFSQVPIETLQQLL